MSLVFGRTMVLQCFLNFIASAYISAPCGRIEWVVDMSTLCLLSLKPYKLRSLWSQELRFISPRHLILRLASTISIPTVNGIFVSSIFLAGEFSFVLVKSRPPSSPVIHFNTHRIPSDNNSSAWYSTVEISGCRIYP